MNVYIKMVNRVAFDAKIKCSFHKFEKCIELSSSIYLFSKETFTKERKGKRNRRNYGKIINYPQHLKSSTHSTIPLFTFFLIRKHLFDWWKDIRSWKDRNYNPMTSKLTWIEIGKQLQNSLRKTFHLEAKTKILQNNI